MQMLLIAFQLITKVYISKNLAHYLKEILEVYNLINHIFIIITDNINNNNIISTVIFKLIDNLKHISDRSYSIADISC